jgi:hypothetical protein
MAKLIPVGSDLIFRMQYITTGSAKTDQSSLGLTFRKEKPPRRVVTLQLTRSNSVIPAWADDYQVAARGTLGTDVILLSFFPDMHRLGKRFQYDLVPTKVSAAAGPPLEAETLLRVDSDVRWQTSYTLVEPRHLKAGTELRVVAWYDNSGTNPRIPNPGFPAYLDDSYDDRSSAGFFDIAVSRSFHNHSYLVH